MGIKDDFLEALNSVKRDLFNGSGNAEPESIEGMANADDKAASWRQKDVDTSDLAGFSAPLPEDEIPPAPTNDQKVFDSFARASSVIDDDAYDSEDDLVEGQAKTDESFFTGAPSVQTADDVDDEGLGGDYAQGIDDSGSQIPVSQTGNYGNKVYDFDRTDLYSDDKTIISKNTVIRGALQTEDSIRLLGQVLGDIDCKSNIVIAGKVRGNTSAANAYVMDAQVDGSLQCDDVISVSSDAWIAGDIRAQQAEIDGKIKGNLDIRHAISIGSTSTIIGDISTDELEVKRGAFVNGNVMMYTPSRDVLDKFDHFDK